MIIFTLNTNGKSPIFYVTILLECIVEFFVLVRLECDFDLDDALLYLNKNTNDSTYRPNVL